MGQRKQSSKQSERATKRRGSSKPKTAKERVLARWPDAYASYSFDLGAGAWAGCNIWTSKRGAPLGQGENHRQAWADAARRLR